MDYIAPMSQSPAHPVETSQWPLPRDGRRIVVPQSLLEGLADHPLCGDCLPYGVGYYPLAAGHRMSRRLPHDHLLIYCVAGAGEAEAGGRRYPVGAGDVIWMAPYCPQWFVAMGKEPASYLYYKDVNRAAL